MYEFKQPIHQVESVLSEIQAILNAPDFNIKKNFIFYNRVENVQALADLDFDLEDVCETIRKLTISDYSATLLDDKSVLSPEYIFVFGNTIKRTPLYIKIKIVDGRIVVCISFHKEKYKMNYPYR